jgi:restriction system protein
MVSPHLVGGVEVPSYQKLMLPLLQAAADGKTHTTAEAFDPIADALGLSAEARAATLPDGRNRLKHRLEWARTYLKKAGLLEYPRRGSFVITKRGRDLLKSKPAEITRDLLLEYPEFREFVTPGRDETEVKVAEVVGEIDPEEAMENAYVALRTTLEAELLDRVKSAPPDFLERLVVDLLLKMGYGGSRKDAGKALGRTGDGGVDGIINEDALGLDVVYIQAKRRTDASVGRPEIQQFVGALKGHQASKGVFITTSNFSREAREYVSKVDVRVVLIDGQRLASLMATHNIGVDNRKEYIAKRIDADYFSED